MEAASPRAVPHSPTSRRRPPSAEVQLKSGGPRAAPTNLNSGEGSESTSGPHRIVGCVTHRPNIVRVHIPCTGGLIVEIILQFCYIYPGLVYQDSLYVCIPAAGQKCNIAMCNNLMPARLKNEQMSYVYFGSFCLT